MDQKHPTCNSFDLNVVNEVTSDSDSATIHLYIYTEEYTESVERWKPMYSTVPYTAVGTYAWESGI